MTHIEAMKQALEAMNAMMTHMGMDEDEWNKVTFDQMRKAIASLRQAIADFEKQEPVAWRDKTTKSLLYEAWQGTEPLYTHPQPKREPLTDEQRILLGFLDGSNALQSVWFGDDHPMIKQKYWWRRFLRQAFSDEFAAHGIKGEA